MKNKDTAGNSIKRLDEKKLHAQIEQAKQERLKKFLEGVQKLQEEHKCVFVPALGNQVLNITIQNQPLTVVAVPL